MLTLTGTVQNAFVTPEGTDRDGNRYGNVAKVQLSVRRKLRNGEFAYQQHDLTVSEKQYYKERVGQEVSIEVEAYAIQNGQSVPIRFKPVE